MKSSKSTLIKIGVILIVLAAVFAKVYEKGSNRPPLKFVSIPESNKEMENNSEWGLSISDIGPFDWENEKDLGHEEWNSESDKNFIVYYKHDKEAVWQGYAQEIMHCARKNIAPLKELFGKYYFADDMNGHRLPIYLPDSEDLFSKTINELLGEESYDETSTNAIIITEIGPLGCLTKGIVIHPTCFEEESEQSRNNYSTILKHEMAHYVFLTSLNYEKEMNHYQWFVDGVADYFCFNRDNIVTGNDSIEFIRKRCKLNDEFPLENDAIHWAGESFFSYLERTHDKSYVKDILKKSYEHSTYELLSQEFLNVDSLHLNWVENLYQLQLDTIPTGL